MSGWLRRWRRVDDLEREVAGLKDALSRISDHSARSEAAVDEVRSGVDRLRDDLTKQASALAGCIEQLEHRQEEVEAAHASHAADADRHAEDIRRSLGESLDELRAELRRLDVRLRTHVAETDKLGTAVLERLGLNRQAAADT